MSRRNDPPRDATPDWWPLARENVEEQPGAREAEAEDALRREGEAAGDAPVSPPGDPARPPGRGRPTEPGRQPR